MKTKELINTAAEKYSNSTVVRAAVSAVPYIGGSLDILLSGTASKIQEKRLKNTLDVLSCQLKQLNENKIDKKYIDSEDFFDDICLFFDQSLKTKSQKKIELLSSIVRSKISGKKCKIDIKSYFNSIGELSDDEIIVLYAIDLIINNKKLHSSDEPDKLFGIDKKMLAEYFLSEKKENIDCEFALIRIEKAGFLKEQTGAFFDYTGGTYYPTRAFDELLDYVKQGD